MEYVYHILDRGKFRILFEGLDLKTIIIQDISDWFVDEVYSKPLNYELEIYFPYNTNPFKVNIFTDKANIFTMKDFGFGDSVFIDGIYCFKIKFKDKEYKIYKSLLNRYLHCYQNYIAITRIDELEKNILKIEFVDSLIKRIPYLVELNNTQEAQTLIKMLETEIKFLNCNC